jgi:cytochrome c biogenesis protein CcmG/thiol:disulfide interchange protein DsbE
MSATSPTASNTWREPMGIVAALLVLLFGFAVVPRLFHASEPALVGKDASDFTLKLVANDVPAVPSSNTNAASANASSASSLTLSSLRGRPVILDFWATWCPPCKAEAPILEKVSQRFRDRGLVVVGVNTSDEDGNARPWILGHHITYPVVFDPNRIATQYGVENLPTLIVVSREGKITAMRTGLTSDEELEELVKSVL